MNVRSTEKTESLYDLDYYRWTQETAELIRQGRFGEVDLEHVAEEIEDMGKRDDREVRSRMKVLLVHLLKWHFQRELRETATWRTTIEEQRSELEEVFEQSPSLLRLPASELPSIYKRAVQLATTETRLGP